MNSESTCRVSMFTPPLMRAARRCRGWWGPGSSMSPGGVKRVIMGEEVRADKLKEKGGREETQLKACGSEGKGKGAHFHREPSFKSFRPRAE